MWRKVAESGRKCSFEKNIGGVVLSWIICQYSLESRGGAMKSIIAAAREELEKLELRRARLLSIIKIAEQDAGPQTAFPIHEREDRLLNVQQTISLVEEILDAQGPMRLGHLLKAIQSRGYNIAGKNPASVLGARLYHSPDYHSLPGAGWWFKARPLPTGYGELRDPEGAYTEPVAPPGTSRDQEGANDGTDLA